MLISEITEDIYELFHHDTYNTRVETRCSFKVWASDGPLWRVREFTRVLF